MKKISIYLSGGLGNQMFQYAFGRALSLKLSCNLVIDDWSGFIRDYQYKRNYELDYFDIYPRKSNFIQKLPIWMLKFEQYFSKNKVQKIYKANFMANLGLIQILNSTSQLQKILIIIFGF